MNRFIQIGYLALLFNCLSCKKNKTEPSAVSIIGKNETSGNFRLQTDSINEIPVEIRKGTDEDKWEKFDTFLIRERFFRDTNDYYFDRYDSTNIQVTIFKAPDFQKALSNFTTSAQYTFLWRPDITPYYVTVSNHNQRKGSEQVYSFFDIKSGNLLVSGNRSEPLVVMSSFDEIRTLIAYHSGDSIPKPVVTWQTDKISHMKRTAGHEYQGVLTVSSGAKNLQKFAIFIPVWCMRSSTLYFEKNGTQRLESNQTSIHKFRTLGVILQLKESAEECPGITYHFRYDKKNGKLKPIKPKSLIEEFD